MTVKIVACSIPSFNSYEGPLSQMLVKNSGSGLKSQHLVIKKCVHFAQPLSFSASAVILRVPVSAGFSPLEKCNYSSVVVYSKTSKTRIATKTGNLLVEFNHCSTVVQSVNTYELSIICQSFLDFKS